MKILASAAVLIAIAGCAPVSQSVMTAKPIGVQSYASVGDVIARFEIKENLPNAFGGADIFGRTRDRGFSELRYMGLDQSGRPVFRRRDVDILTNETTMTRGGVGISTATVQPVGQGAVATGVSTQPQLEMIQALPADTTQFAVDLAKGRVITVRERVIEITGADSAGVSFVIH